MWLFPMRKMAGFTSPGPYNFGAFCGSPYTQSTALSTFLSLGDARMLDTKISEAGTAYFAAIWASFSHSMQKPVTSGTGDEVGVLVGWLLGHHVGSTLGSGVGKTEGNSVGKLDGYSVGLSEGGRVGNDEGSDEGGRDGADVGRAVVGAAVGAPLTTLGINVGVQLGATGVGTIVG